MIYEYDKNKIKESLTLDNIYQILEEFHAEPEVKNNIIIARTICHNHIHEEASRKLYYYENSQLFHCYTGGCEESSFDIFELILKVKNREDKLNWELPQAVTYIAQKFGFAPNDNSFENKVTNIEDWRVLEKYDRIKNIDINNQEIELKEYDDTVLRHLPQPIIKPWVRDNIDPFVMIERGIKYDPKNCGIVIPHYDINNRLIGIRERTMIEENEQYGKYRPAYIQSNLYNHPLSFNLFNINNSKENIKTAKRAFVFESEKSTLQYATYVGVENDISVAVCGSSFIQYQAWLLMQLGVEEIVVGMDKQYQKIGDDEHKKLVKNLKQIHRKYGHFICITYLFDKEGILDYKMSPTDDGLDKLLYLYEHRVNLY